jgi:hypothetical protein
VPPTLSCGAEVKTTRHRKSLLEAQPACGSYSDVAMLQMEHSRIEKRRTIANKFTQSGRQHCRLSHRRHVLRFHRRPQEEPTAKLRAAAEQHPRRARGQIRPEATVELQPPAGHRYPLRKLSPEITYVRRTPRFLTNLMQVM